MSELSSMDLELSAWGDGTVRLSYWDSLEGKDRHFILDKGGAAFEEDEDDNLRPVNLVLELRGMVYGTQTSQ